MKKVVGFLVILVLAGIGVVSAQDATPSKIKFSSQISAGLLEGGNGSSFQLNLISGIKYKTWFGGIGAGLDYYYLRSVPVYFSVVKYMQPKANSLFIQADAGLNFMWQNKNQVPIGWGNEISSRFNPGLYYHTGIGYAIGLQKKNSFLIGLGYSYKFLRNEKEVALACFNPPCPNGKETDNYYLKRVSLRLGMQF
jgi:hypothetical protein